MAKVIEFYVPAHYQKTVRWVPKDKRGKLVTFPIPRVRDAGPRVSLNVNWKFLNRSTRSAK